MSAILSAVQFTPRLASTPADVRDNFRRAEPLLALAGRLDADLVVMPELCLTGCTFMSHEEAAAVAEPLDGWTFRAFREFAVRADAYVAYGLIEDAGDRMHNAAVLVSPEGEIVLVSRKALGVGCDFMWAEMSSDPAPVVETRLGLTSAVVCRDLKNELPEDKEKSIFGDARVQVVAGLTNWGRGFWPPPTWMDFARDNGCVLAVANRCGVEERTGPYGTFSSDFHQGGTAIIEPGGRVHVAGLRFSEDCVVTARVEVPR